MRVVFLGTGDFAVPSLLALVGAGHEVALVVTQPDRPSGRGRASTAPPIKRAAADLSLGVVQPLRVREPETVERIQSLEADVGVVVAYGQILPRAVFAAPRLGTVNVHASLLPRYRGAAPIQWAIACGERETGVTTMLVGEGLDTGPILRSAAMPLGEDATSVSLAPRLAETGAELLVATLAGLATGAITPQPQDDSLATLAPIIRKQDGRVNWDRPAAEIARRARAFLPWPTAFTTFRGAQLKILSAVEDEPGTGPSGIVVAVDKGGIVVACGGGTRLRLVEVQPESKRPMSAQAFAVGARPVVGEPIG